MQRIIMICLWAVSFCLTATADNVLSLSSVQGHPGDEVKVTLSLSGEEQPTALEILIPLNDALKYVENSAVLNSERSNGHTLSAAVKNGYLNIVIYSPTLQSLKGATGELCSLALKLGKEPADYVLTPEVVMSDAAGKQIVTSQQSGVVTLLSPKIEVITSKIDFGHIPIRSFYTKNLTIKNVGNEPLLITQILSNQAELTAEEQNYTIESGKTQNIVLSYAPTLRGAMEAEIRMVTNAINSRTAIAQVVANPYSVNELHVQRVEGNANEEVTVVLNMNNMEPIAGAQCEFTLPAELIYVEGSSAVGNRCSGTDHEAMGVVQGKKLTLMLYSAANTALPEGNGELMTFKLRLKGYSGSYKLTPAEVVLSNITMENMVSATTSNYVVIKSPKLNASTSLAFSSVPVAQEAAATYTLRNYGNNELVINKVTFLSEGYTIADDLPIRLGSYKTAQLRVKTTPQQEGTFGTKMQIYSNDPQNSMHTVEVNGTAYEANQLQVTGRNTEEGYRFTFGLDNYSDVVALQMNLRWNVDMATATNLLTPTERLRNHSYLITNIGEGIYQVLVYSMNNNPIEGTSGELFSLDYEAQKGAAYENTILSIEDVVMSNAQGVNKANQLTQTATAEFTHYWLTLVAEEETISKELIEKGAPIVYPEMEERRGYAFEWNDAPEVMPMADTIIYGDYVATYVLGDVNNDKIVNIADAIALVNYLLSKSSIDVLDLAADVNEDGVVNISDAISLVNKILSKN